VRSLFLPALVLLIACSKTSDDGQDQPIGSAGTPAGAGGATSGGSTNQPSGGSSGSDAGSGGSPSGSGGALAGSGGTAGSASGSFIFDNTTSINGLVPELIGAPVVEDRGQGASLCFDGDDGIVLDTNPVAGLVAFTIEVLFRPESVSAAEPVLNQPRFVHIETAAAARATIEARVNDTQFYLDTYLLNGAQSLTLIDETKVHPVGAWYWAALTYADGQMRHFVEGVEDANGSLSIAPLGPGKISIGVRQNLVHWFKGCVRELHAQAGALPPESLQRVQ
jgi:hypothetical protein